MKTPILSNLKTAVMIAAIAAAPLVAGCSSDALMGPETTEMLQDGTTTYNDSNTAKTGKTHVPHPVHNDTCEVDPDACPAP